MISMLSRIKRYTRYVICMFKILTAFIYVHVNKKKLFDKNIWLIQEKHTEARDNGYHLFKYIRSIHPDIQAYYAITNDSPDKYKVEEYGNVIMADSFRHYVYYLVAKKSIGSQRFGACPYPVDWVSRFRYLCRKDQKVVFLTHGIIANVATSLQYEKTKFDLFVCSSKQEYRYVCEKLHYPIGKAKILGLCRFDNLFNTVSTKVILIMPTFRHWLVAQNREKDANEEECARFAQSDFYRQYSDLLSNDMLLSAAKLYGFKIVFYLHYSLQSYVNVFLPYSNETVTIANRKQFDVQQLLVESCIMITDYSSVLFDFAYMKKPEVYFQFDEKRFREKHYDVGHFDYRNDGFGPVFENSNDMVNYIVRLIKNGGHMENKYQERVDEFFYYHDKSNCERNFQAIKEL